MRCLHVLLCYMLRRRCLTLRAERDLGVPERSLGNRSGRWVIVALHDHSWDDNRHDLESRGERQWGSCSRGSSRRGSGGGRNVSSRLCDLIRVGTSVGSGTIDGQGA